MPFIEDRDTEEILDPRFASVDQGGLEIKPAVKNLEEDNRRFITSLTPGADLLTRYFQCIVTDFPRSLRTGVGRFYFHIPEDLDSYSLFEVHARVITAGTTGTTDIQVNNATSGLDMLSTVLTIDSGETGSETAATKAAINSANKVVRENDLIRIDIDAISTTPPKGLIVTLGFK